MEVGGKDFMEQLHQGFSDSTPEGSDRLQNRQKVSLVYYN